MSEQNIHSTRKYVFASFIRRVGLDCVLLANIVFLPTFIIFGIFSVLAQSKSIYLQIFEKNGIFNNFASKEEAVYHVDNLLGYFSGENLLDSNFFSNQAMRHLADVQNIIQSLRVLSAVAFVVILALSVFLIRSKETFLLKKSLLAGSILTIAITICISSLFALNFSFAFEKIHQVLFRNELWLFSAEDNLIKLFPETFFMSFAIIFILCIITISSLLMLFSQITIKKND